MEKETEQTLIRKAQQGDTHAFRLLVEANQHFAYALACRFIPDKADAEDVVQDAFVRTWTNLSRYDFNFRMKTWLGKIITNLCLDRFKSSKVKNEIRTNETLHHVADGQETHRALEATELKTIVMKLAQQLTPKQRAVFVLRDLEGFEPEEVCQALNMTNGNMKSNLYYARMTIKEQLIRFYREENKAS